MTHPTDDEIMSLAVRYLGEHAAHASTGLHRFARALLAEQARTEPHKAEDAPSDAELADTPTPKPQGGMWTLTAPDGRTYQADSPLRCCGLEQREPQVAESRNGQPPGLR